MRWSPASGGSKNAPTPSLANLPAGTAIGAAGSAPVFSGVDFGKGPGYPSFGPPVHIFSDSKADWVGINAQKTGSSSESTSPLLLNCTMHQSWSEINGRPEVGPQQDLGATAPVAESEQYLFRGAAPKPAGAVDEGPGLKVICCEPPSWVGVE
eukprot:TRINITY_DN69275_c0_g1_i1.p2 TRINITY_DN69275_c0_g1~~TRINITY_DN69275_c0_g1_i1.p2  ORF type:complete len:153 (+),score=26.62 TRINITY_DN69275_c0_g1_i1:361-819(+)